jgi:hypothetical protein
VKARQEEWFGLSFHAETKGEPSLDKLILHQNWARPMKRANLHLFRLEKGEGKGEKEIINLSNETLPVRNSIYLM